MPYRDVAPVRQDRHTLKAQKYDRKADQAAEDGDAMEANYYRDKADKAADRAHRRGGGWR